MRIISGSHKGRRLKFRAKGVRPTSDRVRESVFNILGLDLSGTTVLDLYAGTGALGLEALSRGAHSAVFVDYSREAVQVIRENLAAMGLIGQSRLINKKAAPALKLLAAQGERFSLVFMDPPYRSDEDVRLLMLMAETDVLEPGAMVVVEHDPSHRLSEAYGYLVRWDQRKYGDTAVSFYERREKEK